VLRGKAFRLFSAVAVLIGMGICLQAQETRGQVLGRVSDPMGAVLAGARIEAVNLATNVATSSETNASGDFVLPFLLPGTYVVTAEASGFKKFVQEGVLVQINDRVSLNITLELGQMTEKVEVTAASPLLQSATASSGEVIDNRRIMELPMKDGNPIMLASLATGVTNLTQSGMGRSRPFDNSSISAVSVNGAGSLSNDFTLDGAPNTQQNKIAFPPPAELVQEFKIESASFDASQGFTPGGVINVSLKSGTNALHGSSYYFGQNTALNANSYFNNLGGLPKTTTYMHRYGANATGPVILPKLYNGRDRTFWTYGFEEIRDYTPETASSTAVPTAAEKTGDFSSLLALGGQYQIYDPATITPVGNGRYSRQPLPGNIIPASRLNPTALKIAALWDPPNQPGTVDGSNNLYVPNIVKDTYYTHLFRIDHAVSEKNRMFFRGSLSDLNQAAYLMFNGANGENFYRRNKGLAIDDVHMFSPTLLLNVRYSLTNFLETDQPVASKLDLKQLGFSDQFLQQLSSRDSRGQKLPRILVEGYGDMAGINYNLLRTNIHSVAGSLTQFVRSHSLHYGAELRVYQHNGFSPGQSSGTFSFDSQWTRGPLDSAAPAPMGQSLAAFLLGLPSTGSIDTNDSKAQQSSIWGFYFQDDWKLSSKLTLNLGLRYELELPITERFNRTVSGFDALTPSPIAAQAQANYAANPIPQIPPDQFRVNGGLLFAGVGGQPRALFPTQKNNFMPRFGFAYTVNEKTVLRGGYGIFFDQLGLTRLQVNQTGFNRATVLVPSIDNGETFIGTLANPFPNGIDQPLGAGLGLMTNVGQSVNFFNPKLVHPYMQRWQLSVQRQIIRDGIVEVAYVGNRGTRLRVSQAMDALPREYSSTSPVRDQGTIDFLNAAVPNPFYPLLPRTSLAGATVPRSQLLVPYPQFTGVAADVNSGYSWYHALQTRLEKRLSAGYTINVAYTWSKLMGANSFLNPFDTAPERVIAAEDRTHRAAISGIWELPIGQGKTFLRDARGISGKLVSGWQVQAIYQVQSGAPLGFGNAIFSGNLHDIPLSGADRSIYQWFNVDAGFERDSKKQLASNVRTLPTRFSGIRGPIMNNWDISFLKNTALTEGLNLQFRAELINAFNHTQFDIPNTTPSSTSFGRISAIAHLPRVVQFGLKLAF
jgi:hypothetical protein